MQSRHFKEIDGILCVSPFRDFRVYEPFDPNDKHPLEKVCQHRGKQIRTETCELCGSKGEQEPVYQCSKHGECCQRQYKRLLRDQPETICIGCPDGPWSV